MTVLPPTQTAPRTKAAKPKNTRKEIMSWILTLAAAVAIALLVRTFLFEPIRVDGESMTDTLQNGELMFVTKPEYIFGTPKRQDVIICRYPGRTEYFVKRLIGLPGDTVLIKYDAAAGGNTVYVNGEAVSESYLTPLAAAGGNTVYVNGEAVSESYLTPRRNNNNNAYGPKTLGEDEYFVLGDNRDNSNDSRYVGVLHRSQIAGHVRFVFYPFASARAVEQ